MAGMVLADREVRKSRTRLPHYDNVKGLTNSTGGQRYGFHGIAQCPADPEWLQMHASTPVGCTLILGGQKPVVRACEELEYRGTLSEGVQAAVCA